MPLHYLHDFGCAGVSLPALRGLYQQSVLRHAADHEPLGDTRRAAAGVPRSAVCFGVLSFPRAVIRAKERLAVDGLDACWNRNSGNVCGPGWIAGGLHIHYDADLDASARLPGDRDA